MNVLVLVVDPDTSHLRRLPEVLSREGFNIMTATDRQTALQTCRWIPVQFVLNDARDLGFSVEPSTKTEKDK